MVNKTTCLKSCIEYKILGIIRDNENNYYKVRRMKILVILFARPKQVYSS